MYTLSKSDYLLFLKHPAWLWLKKHDKAKLTPVSENTQAMFDDGNLFETYAEQLFSNGVSVGFSGYSEYLTQPSRTQQVLDDGATTLFQGRFEHDGITCISDVVVKVNESTVDLYEIKSSTEVKDIHEHDLAFQVVVLESCGYTVRSVKVLCVNSEYVRHGDIDPVQFVIEHDITNAVMDLRDVTRKNIKEAQDVMAQSVIPDISPVHCGLGSLKEWLDIYRTLTPVAPGSIYDLCRLNVDLVEVLDTRGITRIIDIPEGIELKTQQALQLQVTRDDTPIVDVKRIGTFLEKLSYPLYFLDYETLASVVPAFDGLKPYQQVPFQYSLHVLEAPGGELKHYGYIHDDTSLPVIALTKSLEAHIGSKGTVLVWYEGFEKTRNTEMGELCPEYHDFYHQLNSRVIDLMIPFARGWYAHKDFLGSASIKKVLPVLIPELSYADLPVHEGGTAQRLWMETVLEGKHLEDRAQIFHDLDAYCTLDTLAMVKIYQKLLDICQL